MRANNAILIFIKCIGYVFGSFLMGSCKCASTGPTAYSVDISYQNSKGEDMFESTTLNYYNKDSVKIIYLTGGKESNLSIYRCCGGTNVGPLRLSNIDYISQSKMLKGIIKLNKTTYDTLTLTGDEALRKVVYNGKTIPPPSGSDDYPQNFYFTVVK